MENNLFHLSVSPLNLIVRAVVVYIAILLLLRISGKRQMGQMGATEFVAILLISNAVQNSMNAGDNSLAGGLLLAGVLISVSWFISVITFKSRSMSLLFEGSPTLLVHKGKLIEKNLEKERLTRSELHVLLRKQGIHDISLLETAILEADGTLSLTKKEERAS